MVGGEPEKMARNGYLIGIDDLEPEVGKMIESGFLSSHQTAEKFEIMKVKFDDLKRELL